MSFFTKKAVFDHIHNKECNVSGDIWEKLDEDFKQYLDRAVERTKANGRKTVYVRDL